MGNPRCKWVRDRLPLLTGDELVGAERRRVERHLIGCPRCRAHRVALGHALEVLHAAAAESPTGAGVPSLWPALARQIRESHRPAPAPAFPGAALLGAFRPRFWLAIGLTLGLLAVLGVTVAARKQAAEARAQILADSLPVPPPARPPALAAPSPASPSQLAQSESAPEAAPAAHYDFDLEHGTPMGPVAVEGKTTSKPTY
jgi:Putative zinc-finger